MCTLGVFSTFRSVLKLLNICMPEHPSGKRILPLGCVIGERNRLQELNSGQLSRCKVGRRAGEQLISARGLPEQGQMWSSTSVAYPASETCVSIVCLFLES